MPKEKFIVLDVEGMSACPPYNVGYLIGDRDGNVYKKRSFALLENIWNNIVNCLKVGQAVEMSKKNVQEILKDVKNPFFMRKYKIANNNQYIKRLIKDIKKYKVKRIFAYNVIFDKNSHYRLWEKELDETGVEWCDIMTAIVESKLLTKKYCNWAVDNGFITDKGNIRYGAEYAYRYLFNDLTFEEEHTGLADVEIEYKILLKCFATHKKLNFEPSTALWRKFKGFCIENNITTM